MKLQDEKLAQQLAESVKRFDALPEWLKGASTSSNERRAAANAENDAAPSLKRTQAPINLK